MTAMPLVSKSMRLQLATAIAAMLCGVVAVSAHAARVALLGGVGLPGRVVTNSILADIDIEDGFVASLSRTDSEVSFAPFPAGWDEIADGTLLCDITVVSGASNIVSVLFGDCDDPALTVESDGNWTILPPGTLRPLGEWPTHEVQTNRLSFVLRSQDTRATVEATAQSGTMAAETLAPVSFDWPCEAYRPENWRTITLLLAGPEARIVDIRAKWRPDGTMLIMR